MRRMGNLSRAGTMKKGGMVFGHAALRAPYPPAVCLRTGYLISACSTSETNSARYPCGSLPTPFPANSRTIALFAEPAYSDCLSSMPKPATAAAKRMSSEASVMGAVPVRTFRREGCPYCLPPFCNGRRMRPASPFRLQSVRFRRAPSRSARHRFPRHPCYRSRTLRRPSAGFHNLSAGKRRRPSGRRSPVPCSPGQRCGTGSVRG